jgi:hypothetical protein
MDVAAFVVTAGGAAPVLKLAIDPLTVSVALEAATRK